MAPRRATEPVRHDADDPALWISTQHPERSLILATDKAEREGGLYVFGLDGKIRQALTPLDRPNNVDVEYGVATADGASDIAAVTERRQQRLRLYRIPADGGALSDLAPNGLPVLAGAVGAAAEPMGVALYRRPRDGATFVIVAPKGGIADRYLWQYALTFDHSTPTLTLVRRFGHFSSAETADGDAGEIEAIAVDDERGYVYYADEQYGIRKWAADPDSPDASRELAVFGTSGYSGDREGRALALRSDGTGVLISSDQRAGGSVLRLFPRDGTAGDPHAHAERLAVPTVADETDGLDVTTTPLPGFPGGLLVMMNSGARNFLLFDWQEVEHRLTASSPPPPGPPSVPVRRAP